MSILLILVLSSMASAIRFDVEQARQEEWDRYEAYREDYVKFNGLEGFTGYLSERNLQRNFGFYGPEHYYIPPDVWNAKYNPPLQGSVYSTANRGYTSSIYQPSAVKYYGDEINGRYAGYIPSNLNGRYFDHPHAYGDPNAVYGYQTVNNPGYDYGGYPSGYSGSGGYGGYGGGVYDIYNPSNSYGGYQVGYGYENQNPTISSEEPAFYARIAEPLSNNFYIVGYY